MADERNRNSFKQLMEEEYESRFTLPQMTEIERRIQRRNDSFRVAGAFPTGQAAIVARSK